MSVCESVHIETNDGAFLINLFCFVCGALIALIEMPGNVLSSTEEIYFNISALLLFIDCVTALSAAGVILFPILSISIGILTALETLKLIEIWKVAESGRLLLAAALMIAVPLHMCVSSQGFNNSLKLAALQRQLRKTEENFSPVIYYTIIITVAFISAAAALNIIYI